MKKIVFLIVIIFFKLWGESPHPYLNQWVNYKGKVHCERETISVIKYGNEPGKINFPVRDGFCGPISFDVDEDNNIYFLENPWIYKYTNNHHLLKTNIAQSNLDFKYYDKKIFVYKKNKLLILNSDNLTKINEILLPDTMTNRYGIHNVSFFDGHYLFLQDFRFDRFEKKLVYIYDLKKNVFSSKIINDSTFNPITNCNCCDLNFVKELIHGGKPLQYLGQTKDYLYFGLFCSPRSQPGICKNDIEQYYIMDKKNKNTWMFNFVVDPNINFTPFRPFVCVNDSTLIYQTLTGNRDGEYRRGSQEELIYSKLHIRFNKNE